MIRIQLQGGSMLPVFSTYVTAIFLEGLFFLSIGVVISSIISVYVPEGAIEKIIPKGRIPGIAVSSMAGLIFPVCECGIVPVIAGLIKKGLPVSNAVTMLLSIPVVNLVTYASTYYAFSSSHEMALLRTAGGIIISFSIGIGLSFISKEKKILKDDTLPGDYMPVSVNLLSLQSSICAPGCSCHDHAKSDKDATHSEKLFSAIAHSVEEFFSTGKYFIIGIFITALLQTFVPKSALAGFAGAYPLPEFFMAAYSYILSICSQTDAFVARSMASHFGAGALLSFMISGAMIDIKTTIMMRRLFSKRFIVLLTAAIGALTLLYAGFAELLLRVI